MPEDLSQNVQEIVEKVEALTVLELSELVKTLEDKFGVSASAPMMVAGGAAPGAAEAEEEEEKTSFDVMLKDFGSQKIKVIKEVRAVTNMGLKEAKGFVEGDLPAAIKEDVTKDEADQLKEKFEAVGATIEIK
ncbi:MAG: 50S ribosomal protein L7/L12 [Candidatus Zixiibacteriota bacterium]